jgi:hypothetical protein
LSTTKRIQATQLTEGSWMASEWGQRVAVISCTADGYSVLSSNGNQLFSNLDQLEKTLGWTVTFEQPKTRDVHAVTIGHLPVKHSTALEIQTEPVASYVKQEGSQVRYAAGYWGLKFTHAWTASFCPKLSTLGEYEHVGPFGTKLEMNTILAQRNRELK